MKAEAKRKLVELVAKGAWPPAGHPWRALALLPKAERDSMFRSQAWVALLEGLAHLRAGAERMVLKTSNLQSSRDEACGIINTVNILTTLESEMADFDKLANEAKEEKK